MKGETKTRAGFTAGPWTWGPFPSFDPAPDQYSIHSASGRPYMHTSGVMTEADARLMAASPDLLEALEKIAATREVVDPRNLPGNYMEMVCGVADEALRKATEGDR